MNKKTKKCSLCKREWIEPPKDKKITEEKKRFIYWWNCTCGTTLVILKQKTP